MGHTVKCNGKSALNRADAPTFIDIFAGCGGLSLGLLQAGWKGLFAVEHEANAFSTLKANLLDSGSRFRFSWPEWLPQSPANIKDVTQKHRKHLISLAGTVDAVVGGPPCQGFSNAGRRDPNDPRNKLITAYLTFVGIINPRVVLIENVKGITSDFEDTSAPNGKINYASWLIASLSKKYIVSHRIIDTSTFGVPQRRHRFVVIAVRRDLVNKYSRCPFDMIEDLRSSFLRSKGISSVPVGARAAISDFELSRNGTIPSRDTNGFEEIAYCGPRTSYQRLMNSGMTGTPSDTRLARHADEIKTRFKKLIKICHSEGRLSVSLSPELRASFGLKKCAIRVLDPDNASPTITSMPDDLIHYSEPRALTVRENARLQSFPDWFTFKGKYTTGGHRRRKEIPRFTQVANAVPPLVAEVLGIALAKYLAKLSKR
jgi:DNA (cytosine-5)-methyltransferase 1